MTTISKIKSRFFILLLFGTIGVVCHAGPTRLIRATPEFAEWAKESEAIVECYRQNLKPPAESKIAPLFVCVHLGLGEPVSESGASLHEVAFVYSEVLRENGYKERKINIFVRSPYEDRKWNWEPLLTIIEMQDPLFGVFLLDDSVDLYKQISDYAKKVTAPHSSSDHTISMIVFEGAVTSLFGRNLDNDALLQMIFQRKAELSEPVEKK